MSRHRFNRFALPAAAAALLLSVSVAPAAVIDFETDPDGFTPVDDAALGAPYIHGPLSISFGSDTDGDNAIDVFARFEDRENNGDGQAGPPPSDAGAEDPHGYTHGSMPYVYDPDLTPDKQGGIWMIRHEEDGDVAGNSSVDRTMHPFLIVYDAANPADLPTSASGQIWDIDSNDSGPEDYPEQYLVEALDTAGSVLDSVLSPLGLGYSHADSLSGLPWNFSFDSVGLIKTIRITKIQDFTGHPRGFTFDNFNATEPSDIPGVPEPASLLVLAAGAALLTARRSRPRGPHASHATCIDD